MRLITDKTAMIFFKEGSKAVHQFGYYLLGHVKGITTLKVPDDTFGKNLLEVMQVITCDGKLFNIPKESIQRIKYLLI